MIGLLTTHEYYLTVADALAGVSPDIARPSALNIYEKGVAMATQAQELAERLRQFNNEMITFIKGVPEASRRKPCEGEQ